MKRLMILSAVLGLAAGLRAAPLAERGNWKIDFEPKDSVLKLENAARRVSLEGRLGFTVENCAWRVVKARDAAPERLSIVDRGDTVLAYASFRGEGDRLVLTVFRRAGSKFFPGVLSFDATARVREESFACRTFAEPGEEVISFADGAGDSPLNDSIFAREEDLALRFSAKERAIRALGKGAYAVRLGAEISDPSGCEIAIEADGAYFKSRWAPGYHPIDRRRCPKAPTGWMSWNVYFDKAGSAENLAEAKIGAKYLKPFGLDIWSIESWQGNSLWLGVSNFHNLDLSCYEPQFPEGMKWLADEIRKLGFVPGLWMPLYGTGDKAFHDAHRDWFLHDRNGKPIDCWNGKYMIDSTNPEVLDHIRKITRTASREWGYEFFKFDGMANTPRKFERDWIRACMKNPKDDEWFDRSVRALREGIGEDRILLGCMGDFTGTEAKYLDASRLGADVVGVYTGMGETYNPLGNSTVQQMPVKWRNVLHQAECTVAQVFVNNLMFYTDPDTLLVGYALEQHEAEVMATIVGLPGQLMFSGDRLASLRPERMKIIQQVLPVADIHPQNLYPFDGRAPQPIWNLAVTRPFASWRVVALFNFSDEPKSFSVPFASLGLDDDLAYTAYEFWSQTFAGEIRQELKADVPMRSVKLFAVHAVKDHPQFVGDDRHLTQGAVELKDLAWDAKAKTYAVRVTAVGGFPLSFAVRVPEAFSWRKTAVPEGVEVKSAPAKDGRLVRVTVTAKETTDVPVTLTFE